MAQSIGIDKDVTNKSGHVTSITKMVIAQMSPKIMALTIGHKNLKHLANMTRVSF